MELATESESESGPEFTSLASLTRKGSGRQVVFEDFAFPSYLPLPSAELAMRAFATQQPEISANIALCGLVVDCGFSATSIVPVFDGNVLLTGVKRINIGGKALTNHLKELVSYR